MLHPGYSLITDIQSKIRQRPGNSEPMDSFVKHVLDRLTGRDLNPLHVEIGTQAGFYVSAAASAWVNFGHRLL